MSASLETVRNLAQQGQVERYAYFSWRDDTGKEGHYGLNECHLVNSTMKMVLSTTFMVQDSPQFTIECRDYTITQAQADYIMDHDLDSLVFLEEAFGAQPVRFELNLSAFQDADAAYQAFEALNHL